MDALKVVEHLGSVSLVSVDEIANLCLDDALVHLIDKQESFNLLLFKVSARVADHLEMILLWRDSFRLIDNVGGPAEAQVSADCEVVVEHEDKMVADLEAVPADINQVIVFVNNFNLDVFSVLESLQERNFLR